MKGENQPNILDVVKIDGRWAQVMGGGSIIRYLKSGGVAFIDWKKFKLVRKFNVGSVANAIILLGETFLPEEILNIHFGSAEQKADPLVRFINTAFGEFVAK